MNTLKKEKNMAGIPVISSLKLGFSCQMIQFCGKTVRRS